MYNTRRVAAVARKTPRMEPMSWRMGFRMDPPRDLTPFQADERSLEAPDPMVEATELTACPAESSRFLIEGGERDSWLVYSIAAWTI